MKTSLTCFICIFVFTLQAQLTTKNICNNSDCSSEIMDIDLNEPIQPNSIDGYTESRTNNFVNSFIAFKKVKSSEVANSDWQSNYNNFELGGKNCLWYYQLETYFGYEYLKNPAFKQFIDEQDLNGKQFKQQGFNSSRRGLNLERRMASKCPKTLKDLEKGKGNGKQGMRTAYQELGQDLGYFDEDGQPTQKLVMLDQQPKAENDKAKKKGNAKKPRKMSKRKQVKQLKEQVSKLPTKEDSQPVLEEIAKDLSAVEEALLELKEDTKKEKAKESALFVETNELKKEAKDLNESIDEISDFEPKSPRPDLTNQLELLAEKGNALKAKTRDIAERSEKLNQDFGDVQEEAKNLENGLKESNQTLVDLTNQLENLEKANEELTKKLENKPKKRLEELKKDMAETEKKGEDFSKELANETTQKDELLKGIKDLKSNNQTLEEDLGALEQAKNSLKKEKETVVEQLTTAQVAVKTVQIEETQLEDMKKQLDDLPSKETLKSAIVLCKNSLGQIPSSLEKLEEKQVQMKEENELDLGMAEQSKKETEAIGSQLDKLQLDNSNEPLMAQVVKKANDLNAKTNNIQTSIRDLETKKAEIDNNIKELDRKIYESKLAYNSSVDDFNQLGEQLDFFQRERENLQNKLNKEKKKSEEISTEVNDFMWQFKKFEKETGCLDLAELEKSLATIEKEQQQVAEDKSELTLEKIAIDEKVIALDLAVNTLQENAVAESKKIADLQREEIALQEEFGNDLKLQPIPVKEWSESTKVERPYWEATINPEKEMVEGFKGRYFELRLKNANKEENILFPVGKYYIDKKIFREKYGATMGSFVSEALYYLKENEADQVKLFIQGSADIVGSETFRGKMDTNYLYEAVDILPLKDGSNFGSEAVVKNIPKTNFRNDDLPDLRAQYLKEIVGLYTEKFAPVLLEGAVTETEDARKRNAIIYLFFPENILTEE